MATLSQLKAKVHAAWVRVNAARDAADAAEAVAKDAEAMWETAINAAWAADEAYAKEMLYADATEED